MLINNTKYKSVAKIEKKKKKYIINVTEKKTNKKVSLCYILKEEKKSA